MANISLAKNFVQVSCKFFFFVTLLNYLFYLAKCTIFLFDSITEKPEWLSNPIKKKKKHTYHKYTKTKEKRNTNITLNKITRSQEKRLN